jgi:eukaryotic-like serine/threonine-protein kinase
MKDSAAEAAGGNDPTASPFAGLLAEASRVPGPLPAGRKVQAPTVDLRGQAPDALPDIEAKTDVKPKPSVERRIGPYKVLEEVGSGGMAVVYKAIQPSLDRIVAIKELRAEYVHDRQIAARFAREATSLATLQHENIVHIYDYLYDYESAHIVMEFVEGIDLFDLLAGCQRLPAEVAAIIALEIARGLEYAHYRAIVHRDIKPSNVLISKSGEIKVMDFGIARDPVHSELTQVGIAVGTPAYMAPEQIRGDKIDSRTDVFAVGIVLYEMLCGEKPWPEEEGRSVTVRVLDEAFRPIKELAPGVPAELARVIDRCLEKDPEQRYASTYELRRELEIYVHRAVPIDPRGRMVLFLRNRNLISESEASTFIHPKLLADAHLKRRDQGIPLPPARELLRPLGIAHAVCAGMIIVAGLVAAFAPIGRRLPPEPPKIEIAGEHAPLVAPPPARDHDRSAGDREPGGPRLAESAATGAKPGKKALDGTEGFLRVIVEPWARVFVDGDFYDLTPFADAIPLSPGAHRIGFRNPYFKPIDHTIEIVGGTTKTMKVSLLPKEEGEDTSDKK